MGMDAQKRFAALAGERDCVIRGSTSAAKAALWARDIRIGILPNWPGASIPLADAGLQRCQIVIVLHVRIIHTANALQIRAKYHRLHVGYVTRSLPHGWKGQAQLQILYIAADTVYYSAALLCC